MNLRVLVVDDSIVFRKAISDALLQIPNVEVVGSAPNGKIALERAESLAPDLMTLDIEMPEMDGLAVLNVLRERKQEKGVIVVSALTQKGSTMTIKALELGAFDFITKPTGSGAAASIETLKATLSPIISAFRRRMEIRGILKAPSNIASASSPVVTTMTPVPETKSSIAALSAVAKRMDRVANAGSVEMVLIGISTGGPNALALVLPNLPASFPVPIFIVQHMPPMFTESLATSLNSKSQITVVEAKDGDIGRPGTAYIAPGGKQMKLTPGSPGEIVVRITDDPPENNCRPAADYLFRSASIAFPGKSAAAIMTGMGSDGVLGLRLLKRHGCRVIAQDEASCVVFGMPGEAVKAGVVDAIVPLDNIADEIRRSVRGG